MNKQNTSVEGTEEGGGGRGGRSLGEDEEEEEKEEEEKIKQPCLKNTMIFIRPGTDNQIQTLWVTFPKTLHEM